MRFLCGLACVIAGLAFLYLFLVAPRVRGRRARRAALTRQPLYAHRGLHDGNRQIPENSLPAFRLAAEKGYGVELDVHLTADGVLAVHHDDSLKRLCGVDRRISEITLAELSEYRLAETQEKVPTLDEVLEAVGGRVPLIVELKSDRPGDTALAEKLNARMARYSGFYCVESFDPLLMRWYKKHAPQVIRGQLAADAAEGQKYADFWHFAQANLLGNFLSRPDFVAYGYRTDGNFGFQAMRLLFRPLLVAWTVRSQQDFEKLQKRYDAQIFEAFIPRP